MKPSDHRTWADLIRLARADRPPVRDVDALVRLLRLARPVAAEPRFDEIFATLFASPRALLLCAAATSGCLVFTVWQGIATWHLLQPWLELVAPT